MAASSVVVNGVIVGGVVSLKKEEIKQIEKQEEMPLVIETRKTSGCAESDYCVVPDHNSIGL